MTKNETKKEASKTEDAELVKLAQAGDQEAFRKLVLLYERRALNLAYSLVGNISDAEDIVQDAFMKAYRSIGSFRGQSSFYTWLYRIISNLNIDYARKRIRKKENNIGEASIIDASIASNELAHKAPMGRIVGPDKSLENLELGEQIQAAINSLSVEHKEVILLREIEGLSYAEISQSTGCSKGTVMSRLHHARKKLQKFLEEITSEEVSISHVNNYAQSRKDF